MGRVLLKSRADIIVDLIDALVSRTNLSDVNDASVMKHLLSAVGAEIFDVYGQFTNLASLFDFQKAEGDDLDERAKEILGGTLLRNGAARAIGSLTFSRATAGVLVNIPIGTSAVDDEGTEFTTTAAGTIAPASLSSGNIAARATVPGTDGNVIIGTVTSLSVKPPGVETVTNDTPFIGGADRETDAEFRTRIEDFVQSLARSTVDGIESALMGVTDTVSGKSVRYVHVYESPIAPGTAIAYIDDGSGSADVGSVVTVGAETIIAAALGGEEFLYTDHKPLLDNIQSGTAFEITRNGSALSLTATGLNGVRVNWASGRIYFTQPLNPGDVIEAKYQYYTELMAEAQRVVDGDPLNRIDYPGYRAAGVDVRVLAPQPVQIAVAANITILDGYSEVTVAANVESNIIAYINSLGISDDVIRAEIIERIMATEGVYNVNVTDVGGASVDYTVADYQIARTDASQVTIT